MLPTLFKNWSKLSVAALYVWEFRFQFCSTAFYVPCLTV